MIDNVPIHVTKSLKDKIEYNFRETMLGHKKGLLLFYSDIDKFKDIMLKELDKDKIIS